MYYQEFEFRPADLGYDYLFIDNIYTILRENGEYIKIFYYFLKQKNVHDKLIKYFDIGTIFWDMFSEDNKFLFEDLEEIKTNGK